MKEIINEHPVYKEGTPKDLALAIYADIIVPRWNEDINAQNDTMLYLMEVMTDHRARTISKLRDEAERLNNSNSFGEWKYE